MFYLFIFTWNLFPKFIPPYRKYRFKIPYFRRFSDEIKNKISRFILLKILLLRCWRYAHVGLSLDSFWLKEPKLFLESSDREKFREEWNSTKSTSPSLLHVVFVVPSKIKDFLELFIYKEKDWKLHNLQITHHFKIV